ncbi:MAG: 30S ribosomal protein S6 [Clostridium sp.]|uniref:30S ribosomal protein S6 n=1 Tax=Clostridium sp. TaxID=1506 RepID=UPI002909652C|nr:30S ribosomal protein S6 [Clostridium sp.]MDU7337015.1 30S ribosomal protein S6 [Clostridium sp.]
MPDVKNAYETVFILSTAQGEEAVQTNVQKFKTLIEKNAVIDSVDEWGKRRFAYPIEKQTEGYYTLINFTSAPDFIAELDRIYKITDGVLRSLIVKKEVKKEKPKKAVEVQKTETAERE